MKRRGFWATLIGAVVGGALGLYLGGLVGWLGSGVLMILGLGFDEEFGDFSGVFAIAGVGAWLGCLLGAYGALTLAKDVDRGRTILWLALLAPALVGAGSWLAVSLTDADDFGSNFLPYVIFTASVLATAYLARRLGRGEVSSEP